MNRESGFSIIQIVLIAALVGIFAWVISQSILSTRIQLSDSKVRSQMDNMIQTVSNYSDECRSILEAAKKASDAGGTMAGQFSVTISESGGDFTGGSISAPLTAAQAALLGEPLIDTPSSLGVLITNQSGKPLIFSNDDIRLKFYSSPQPHFKPEYRTIDKKRVQGNSLVYGDHRNAFTNRQFGTWVTTTATCTPARITPNN